jgi:hypothetical protein
MPDCHDYEPRHLLSSLTPSIGVCYDAVLFITGG